MRGNVVSRLVAIVLPALLLSGCGGQISNFSPSAKLLRAGDASNQVNAPIVYVANFGSGSIVEFRTDDRGSASPFAVIAGGKTGLAQPQSIAVDSGGRIYVSQPCCGSKVLRFAPHAVGDVFPSGTLGGSKTRLQAIGAVAVDKSDHLWVTNEDSQSDHWILEFPKMAAGNIPPSRSITCCSGQAAFHAIAFDAGQNIYVLTNAGVDEFSANARGAAAPIRTIIGSNTGMQLPQSMAVAPDGTVYVGNGLTREILIYGPKQNGNVAPIKRIAGLRARVQDPHGMTLDSAQNLWVCLDPDPRSGPPRISEWAAGAHGNVPPIRKIIGEATQLAGPAGIVIR